MFWILQAVAERLRALLATSVALDFEAEVAARQAARKAELLRQAQEYETEGLDSVAAELREQAAALSLDRPGASALAAVAELQQPLPGVLLDRDRPVSGRLAPQPATALAAGRRASVAVSTAKPPRRNPR